MFLSDMLLSSTSCVHSKGKSHLDQISNGGFFRSKGKRFVGIEVQLYIRQKKHLILKKNHKNNEVFSCKNSSNEIIWIHEGKQLTGTRLESI